MTDQLDRLNTALRDRYAIERELGAGGMATVYLAEDLKHHRKVAVKVLRPELAAALGPERFLREIEVTAGLAGCSGHLDAARSYFERLASVDPMAGGVNPHWCDYYSGRFDEAADGYRVEWEIDPGSPHTRWAYGKCLAWAGRIEEGCEILGRIVEDSPATSQGQFARFLIPALQRDHNGALSAMTPGLEALARRDLQYSWAIGAGYAMLGMLKEALAWLEQAVSRGFVNYPFLAEHDPFLASLRSEPLFQEFLKEVEQRWETFEP